MQPEKRDEYCGRENEPEMTTTLENYIAQLSIALSGLKATGEDGFEGLIAVTLNAITGVPFRLANSGYCPSPEF